MTTTKWVSPFNLRVGDRLIASDESKPVKITRVHRGRVSVWFELEDLGHTKIFVPGDEVRVMLHPRDDDVVARADVRLAPRARDEVDRLRRAAREDERVRIRPAEQGVAAPQDGGILKIVYRLKEIYSQHGIIHEVGQGAFTMLNIFHYVKQTPCEHSGIFIGHVQRF